MINSLRSIGLALTLLTLMTTSQAQTKATPVDLVKYSGKWYVIACIPTPIDKKWDYVTESYTLNKKGNIEIYTTYIKQGGSKEKSVTSKGFPHKDTGNLFWDVQFIWPFTADYLIEEYAPDYSYTVIGHPKKKYLYIMARENKMPDALYIELVDRYKGQGYEMNKLRKLKQ